MISSLITPLKTLQHCPHYSFTRPLHNLLQSKKLLETHNRHPIDSKLIKPGICCQASGECPDEDFMHSYYHLIEGNKTFVKNRLEQDPNYFKELAKSQHPNYFFISCSDSRVPPNELTSTKVGDIFVHRNVANQVKRSDLNCQSALFYAVEALKVKHIIVLGHTHCGGIAAAAKNQSLGIVDLWLQNVRDIAVENKDILGKIKDQNEFLTKLTELNIRHQTLNVCKSAVVQKAWAEGRNIRVSGWICDIETGLIKDLDVAQKEWEEIKQFFLFSFKEDSKH